MNNQKTSFDNIEQYVVQSYIAEHWVDDAAFEPDYRANAILKAKSISEAKPGQPVRVVYDSFNKIQDHHTRAIIYSNGISEHPAIRRRQQLAMQPAKKERERVGLLEYIAILFYVLVIAAIAGIVTTIFGDLVLKALEVYLANDMRQNVLAGIFLTSFAGSLFLAYQYITTKYVYDPHKKRSHPKLKSKSELRQEKRDARDKAVITDHMKSAAEAISKMPILDHSDKNALKSQQAIKEQVEEEESLKPHPLAQKQQTEQKSQEAKTVRQASSKKTLIHTFISDCIKQLKRNRWPLDHRVKYGLSILMMGALEKLCENNDLDTDDMEPLAKEVLSTIGMKGNALDRFILACETYSDHKIHRQLLSNGAYMIDGLDAGDPNALDRLSAALFKWLQEENNDDGFDEYILSIECLPHLENDTDTPLDETVHGQLGQYFLKNLSPLYPLFMEQSGAAFVYNLLGDSETILNQMIQIQSQWIGPENKLAEYYDPPKIGLSCEIKSESQPFIPQSFDDQETKTTTKTQSLQQEELVSAHTQATFLSLKAHNAEILVSEAVAEQASETHLGLLRHIKTAQLFESDAEQKIYLLNWQSEEEGALAS